MPKCKYFCSGSKTIPACCLGAKGMPTTTCEGDVYKCSEYPDVHPIEEQHENLVKEEQNEPVCTAEMWLLAQNNPNKWYMSADMYYNSNRGFCDVQLVPWPLNAFGSIEEIMLLDDWKEASNLMTREEIYNKYNVMVVD